MEIQRNISRYEDTIKGGPEWSKKGIVARFRMTAEHEPRKALTPQYGTHPPDCYKSVFREGRYNEAGENMYQT